MFEKRWGDFRLQAPNKYINFICETIDILIITSKLYISGAAVPQSTYKQMLY